MSWKGSHTVLSYTQWFQKVSGIRWYNFKELLLCLKNCTVNILLSFRDTLRRKGPHKWRTNSWFLLHNNAAAHRSDLVKDFVKQCDNTGASPILSWPDCSWFLSVPSTVINIEGSALLWCCWRNWECDGRAEKDFTKWLRGMFPTHLQKMA